MSLTPAVFLDRDGVLIEDVDLLTREDQIKLIPGVPQSLSLLHQAGYRLIVVSNQAVVARGLSTESEVQKLHHEIGRRITESGGPVLDGCYFCPHHPQAKLAAYRVSCECRKPRPGLLLRAAEEHRLDLRASVMVGDRLTDVVAGLRAGCRTIQVLTGRHSDPPIQTTEPLPEDVTPDHACSDLSAAVRWILEGR